jgi:hypothetical protein
MLMIGWIRIRRTTDTNDPTEKILNNKLKNGSSEENTEDEKKKIYIYICKVQILRIKIKLGLCRQFSEL